MCLGRSSTDTPATRLVPKTAESTPAGRATGATDSEPRDNQWYGCQVPELYNQERPHQGIDMRYPSELYKPSPRPYTGLPELNYPFHDMTITVTQCGRLCFGRRKINLSQVFAGQNVGVREVADHIWLISFMHYDLGFFDDETSRVECAPNPFSAKVSTMCPV